jgi:hypothetical protein
MAKQTKKPKTVDTLERNDCRWPIGDPRHADFHFCGAPQVAGRLAVRAGTLGGAILSALVPSASRNSEKRGDRQCSERGSRKDHGPDPIVIF